MPDAVFIAIFGLLFLIPLEIAVLIVIASLKKRPAAPQIVVPEPKKQERYGWEDYLKFPSEPKKEPGKSILVPVLIIAAIVMLVTVPAYMFGVPQILGNRTANDTLPVEVEMPDVDVEEPVVDAANFSLNISLPGINLSMSFLNVSGLVDKVYVYKPYIYAVIAAIVVLGGALAVFMYFIKRRKLAVIVKARKTADKLMGNGKKKSKVQEAVAKLSFLKSARPYAAPLAILFLLVIIAMLVYLLRDRIRTDLADLILTLFTTAKAFVLSYRLYIAAGVLALIVAMMALRRSKKKA